MQVGLQNVFVYLEKACISGEGSGSMKKEINIEFFIIIKTDKLFGLRRNMFQIQKLLFEKMKLVFFSFSTLVLQKISALECFHLYHRMSYLYLQFSKSCDKSLPLCQVQGSNCKQMKFFTDSFYFVNCYSF